MIVAVNLLEKAALILNAITANSILVVSEKLLFAITVRQQMMKMMRMMRNAVFAESEVVTATAILTIKETLNPRNGREYPAKERR